MSLDKEVNFYPTANLSGIDNNKNIYGIWMAEWQKKIF